MGRMGDMVRANKAKVTIQPERPSRIALLDRTAHEPIDMSPWKRDDCTLELRKIQKEALGAIRDMKGAGFMPIGVGWGKTFIELLAPVVSNKKLAIILAPSATLENVNNELAFLKTQYKMPPIEYKVMSYGILSRSDPNKPETFDKLKMLMGDYGAEDVILMCDEAHKLANIKTSARAARVMRFIKENPKVSVVMLSGTMTQTSMMDFHHLLSLALREHNPLPLIPKYAKKWARSIDVDIKNSAADFSIIANTLKKYDPELSYHEAHNRRNERVRKAFAIHLLGARGVVGTVENALNNQLFVNRIMRLESFDKRLKDLYKQVAETGESPNGEEVYADPASMARALQQMSMGFYYKWVWPDDRPDFHWMETKATFSRLMRHEIQANKASGYDSPLLVEAVIRENPMLNTHLHEAMVRWDEHKHKPDPPVEPVWVSDKVVEECVQWAFDNMASLWYTSRAVADKIEQFGMTTYRAGDKVQSYLGDFNFPAAWSIRAHGTGLNMQGYSRALIMEPPASGAKWEQLLGRLHRPGQLSEAVRFYVLQHTERLQRSYHTALKKASYIENTQRQPQKLISSTKITTNFNQNLNVLWD